MQTGPADDVPEKAAEQKAENAISNLVRKGSDAPEVNQALLQKLMEIDKALKQKDNNKNEVDCKLMPPPPTVSRGLPSSSQITSESRSRSFQPESKMRSSESRTQILARANSFGSTGSLNEAGQSSISSLPPSFQRGHRVSKSARPFGGKVSDPVQRPLTSSNKGSPSQIRKQGSLENEKASRPGSG